MKKLHLLSVGVGLSFLVGCQIPPQKEIPRVNVTTLLSQNETDAVNGIVFEVQKVLSTIDSFRASNSLDYIKLAYKDWKVSKKSEHVLFFKNKVLVAEKTFPIPKSCVKHVGGVVLNACHIKLVQLLTPLAEAYDCEIDVKEVRYPLSEKVVIQCSY